MLLRASRWSTACLSAATLTVATLTVAGLAVVASPVAASAQISKVRYVALGDSYSAGVGAGSYSDGACDQSANAYPVLWAKAHRRALFRNQTCSGATTSTVLSSQLAALSAATTLVSITIGGNDVGFSSVLTTCVIFSTSRCVAAIAVADRKIATRLPGRLDRVLAAIGRHAPAARVVVLGYPDLYDLAKSSGCIGLSTTDRIDLNRAANRLDAQVRAAAERHHDIYADVRSAFAGHQICDDNRWLHSVDWLDLGVSYHPTSAGQADAYYPVFRTAAR
jgi:lysophospholipase L1-like esterase